MNRQSQFLLLDATENLKVLKKKCKNPGPDFTEKLEKVHRTLQDLSDEEEEGLDDALDLLEELICNYMDEEDPDSGDSKARLAEIIRLLEKIR